MMDLNKISAVGEVLNRRTKNLQWKNYHSWQSWHVWEATATINGVEYKASYNVDNGDSIEMTARRIIKSVYADLARQLFSNL